MILKRKERQLPKVTKKQFHQDFVGEIGQLKKMIKAGQCDGANRYVENFDWYKAHQKRVIKNWNMPDYNW